MFFNTEAKIRAEYTKSANALITRMIANIKTDTDYDNLLPVLEFAEKMQLISTDDGIKYYQLATNNIERIQKARQAEKAQRIAERAAKAKAAKEGK